MEQVRARLEQSLFGRAVPARFGRYTLQGKLGDGGMGVVYAGYDPELHRKVALKVLHARQQHGRAQERLIAEARALARLDHPNVVRVHDVISHDDQVVLVLERIEGATLAVWERAAPRSWRAILPVYIQAARGLAAAHGVGVIHRDFKPTNAIVGDDGRVRVLDFGLARSDAMSSVAPPGPVPAVMSSGSDEPSGPSGPSDLTQTGLTQTGALVGTLGYAPPEQLRGAAVTPASDQFSFAVSLHCALEGIAPFTGDDITSRLAAIQRGKPCVARDDRRVPAWLRAAVARCLAASPDARFPSMDAVLSVLTRPRGWRRWRSAAAVVAVAAVAGIAGAAQHGAATPPVAACDGGLDEIERVWNPRTRMQIATAFAAIAVTNIADTGDRVLQGLDRYRARWTEIHRDACMAHRRGAQSRPCSTTA